MCLVSPLTIVEQIGVLALEPSFALFAWLCTLNGIQYYRLL